MSFDFIMDYEKAKRQVDKKGWEGFMESFDDGEKFYSVSQYWYDDPTYICKMKGRYGDKIIGWKGVHEG